MKVCSKCKLELPLTSFWPRKDVKGGLRADCKECKAKQDKARRINNPDSAKEQQNRNYARRKENGKHGAYYTSHREDYIRRSRENPNRAAACRASAKKYYAKYYAAYLNSNWYIRYRITKRMGLDIRALIPSAFIEAQRAQLQLIRTIKEKNERNG